MKHFFKNLYTVTKIILLITPVILLGWLIKKDLVLDGHLEYAYDFSQDSPFITNLFPANRLSSPITDQNSYWQTINSEPIYFETRLPQGFDTAEVKITFQNPQNELVQVGLATQSEGDWSYDFRALQNPLLDNLNWFKISDENGTIWQKTKKYLSWAQFMDDINNIDNLAAYNYQLDRKLFLTGYRPSAEKTVINKTIRGSHSFYTYIKDEIFDFKFIYQDINRDNGPDLIAFKVYNSQGEEIFQKKANDDGKISNLDPASEKKIAELKINGLPEGVYRVEMSCNDDILFRSIETRQRYITFINRLYLADNVNYADGLTDLELKPTAVYSTIPRLGFETSHEEGLQTIGLSSGQSIDIKTTHQNYFLTAEKIPAYIYVPKNDVKIFGRGLLALTEASYFNPEIYQLRDISLTDNIDYLISGYQTPEQIGNSWQTGSVKFSLANASVVNRKLRFAISIPELNDTHSLFNIAKIEISLDKRPLTYQELLQKFIKYLKDHL